MSALKYILYKKVSLTAYLFLLITFQGLSATQWDLTEDDRTAYNHIIALQFSKADPLLKGNRPAVLYLQNLRQSLELIITEDPALMDNYKSATEIRIKEIEKTQDPSPYKAFYLAEIKLHSAFVNLKMGDNWTAAWEFRKAYKLIRKNASTYPKFIPNYKSLGMLHIMLGSVPEKYQWILSLLGMEGSVEEGISEIQKVADGRNIFHREAEAIHYLLEAYLLNNTAIAATNFQKVYLSSYDNLLFGYLYMSLLMKDSRSQTALEVYEHLKELKDGYIAFNFLNYSAGEIYLQQGNYPMAEKLFKEFISANKGSNFVKDAHYKLFLSYWLSDQDDKARVAHTKAKAVGETKTEADKYAAKSIADDSYPNKTLMKIRLATDGGFYTRAKQLLLSKFIAVSKKDQVEFAYRKARLYHKTAQTQAAIKLYQETIDASKGEHWYFAPNSCLQLGYIYRSENKPEKARTYFEQVLDYGDHEYKTSLENKARAGLAGLVSSEN